MYGICSAIKISHAETEVKADRYKPDSHADYTCLRHSGIKLTNTNTLNTRPTSITLYTNIIEDFSKDLQPLDDLVGCAVNPRTDAKYGPALQLAPQTSLPHQLGYSKRQPGIMVFAITACALDDLDTCHQPTPADVAKERILLL